jgi:TolB-like protein
LRVSVLYFDNATGDSQFDVLRKGLADMIVTDLAAVPGVEVVEREKLEALLTEQKLQGSRLFDPATAVRTGKLFGASHVVTGTITAVAPKMRIDLRMIDVAQGKVLATSQIAGAPQDLFDLEQQLVQSFVAALHLEGRLADRPSGRTSANGLLAYSRALDQTDRGDAKAAQSAMVAAMQASPSFTLARTRYAELLRRVSAATDRRSALMDSDEAALRAHLEEWCSRPLAGVDARQLRDAFGYRLLRLELARHRIVALTGQLRSGIPRVVPASKREELTRLELAAVAAFDALIADLVPWRDRFAPGPLLLEEDVPRAKALLGEALSGRLPYRAELIIDRDRLVLLGEPGSSRNAAYRPSLAMRDPKQLDAGIERLKAALGGLDDFASFQAAELQGEALLRAGRREDAVAAWQRFLDAWPQSSHFDQVKARLEDAIYASPLTTQGLKRLETCSDDSMLEWQTLFGVVGLVEGRPGLERLLKLVEGCAGKKGSLAMGWRFNAYLLVGEEGMRLGDCGLVQAMAAKKDAREPGIKPAFDSRFADCLQ